MKSEFPDILRLLFIAFDSLLIVYALTKLFGSNRPPVRQKAVTSTPTAYSKPLDSSNDKGQKKSFSSSVRKTAQKSSKNVGTSFRNIRQKAASDSPLSETTPASKPLTFSSAKTVQEDTKQKSKKPKRSSSGNDDLTIINGIGPKSEQILKKNGINDFSKLSSLSSTQIKDILVKADKRYEMYDVRTWPKQAKLAEAGEWSKLSNLKRKNQDGFV